MGVPQKDLRENTIKAGFAYFYSFFLCLPKRLALGVSFLYVSVCFIAFLHATLCLGQPLYFVSIALSFLARCSWQGPENLLG